MLDGTTVLFYALVLVVCVQPTLIDLTMHLILHFSCGAKMFFQIGVFKVFMISLQLFQRLEASIIIAILYI